ncbi:unnamed protein product, partial [Mesorhabditis spiculigera]
MLFVYLLVLVLNTGGMNAANTTMTAAMCNKESPDCEDCVKKWTLCPGKDGVLLCTLKQYLVDPESADCEFLDCPVGELPSLVGYKRTCVPRNRMTNGTLPTGWWWDGCIYDYYINCGNYVPVCLNAATITAYNASAGGCINEGCPPATHPCKGENGTECIAYDDLKSTRYKKGGDVCVLATAEEKAAARPTVPPAAQEKTEPKETSPASCPSCYLVNSVFIVLAIRTQLLHSTFMACPGKDGTLLCTVKLGLVDPNAAVCDFIGCPMGQASVRIGRNQSCIPLNRLTNATLPNDWWWDGCLYPFNVNCGNYVPVCVKASSLQEYNTTLGGCVKEGCPPTTHPCKVDGGTECIAYDDLNSVASGMLFVYLLILVLYTGELSAENTTLSTDVCPKDSDACKGCTGSWVACPGKDGAPICSKKYNQVDPKGSICQYKECPVGEGQIVVGKGLLCVPFKHFVNGSLPGSYLWEGCQQKAQINCGTWTPICFYPDLVMSYNDSLGGCIMEGCEPTKLSCKTANGTECIAFDDLKSSFMQSDGSYNCTRATAEDKAAARATLPPAADEKTEPKKTSPASRSSWLLSVGDHDSCQLVNPNELSNLKPAKECAGMKNTLACWAANDDYTCIGFERINSMTVDKQNKTICTFAKCTGEDALLCSAECQSIHEVKRVLPGGECEFRTLRRGQIIMIISCSIIGTVGAIAIVVLLTRAIILQKNRNKPIEHRPSSMENKHQDGDSNEKRPFLPSKNPKAFNEKPQV